MSTHVHKVSNQIVVYLVIALTFALTVSTSLFLQSEYVPAAGVTMVSIATVTQCQPGHPDFYENHAQSFLWNENFNRCIDLISD
jgi:hypothetical protein